MAGMQGSYQLPLLPRLAIGDWQLISWRYAGCVCRFCCLTKYSYIGNCQWNLAIAVANASGQLVIETLNRTKHERYFVRFTPWQVMLKGAKANAHINMTLELKLWNLPMKISIARSSRSHLTKHSGFKIWMPNQSIQCQWIGVVIGI